MSLTAFFDSHDITVDEFRALRFDAANGTLSGDKKKSASDIIKEAMFAALEVNPADYPQGRVPRKVINRAFRRHHVEAFEIIEDVVDDKLSAGWSTNPFFLRWVEFKQTKFGDENHFIAKKKAYLAVNRIAGNNWDMTIQRLSEDTVYQVPTYAYGAKIGTDIRLYLEGRKDWAELIDAIVTAMDRKVKDLIYAEVSAIGSAIPANSQFHKTSVLDASSKETFDQLIADVSTANDNSDIVIMGTRSALGKVIALTTIDWVSGNMKDEMNRTGRIGYYEGNLLMEVPQRFANGDTTKTLVSDKQILIVPAGDGTEPFIKFVDEGDGEIVEKLERKDYQDDTMSYEYHRTLGVGSVINQYLGVWTLP